MPIEPVENKEEKKEQQNKPLLNIQLPAPMSGDPNAPLSVGRHNAVAQHNFEQVANVLLSIINNQKIIGMTITQLIEKQKLLEENIKKLSDNLRELLILKEKENKENDKSSTSTTNK